MTKVAVYYSRQILFNHAKNRVTLWANPRMGSGPWLPSPGFQAGHRYCFPDVAILQS
jgi:hypothetical protein